MIKHWLILALVSLSLVGCGEIATYSKQSRERGDEYLKTGQYTEAEGAYRDAVRQNPRDFRSHYQLAKLAERNGQYTAAVTSYRTSLAVQPYSLDAEESADFRHQTIIDLGKCLAKADTRDSEINALENEAASDKSGEKYLILAHTFIARGDADSAMTAFANAQAQAPGSFYIQKDAGLYLERIGQKALAEAALRRAYRIKAADRDPDARNDEDINNALRRMGIVPGPALKEEGELAKPLLPRGPLPELNTNRTTTPPPAPQPTPVNPAE